MRWRAFSLPRWRRRGLLRTWIRRPNRSSCIASQRLFYLSYLANLMNSEPGSKPEEAAKKSAAFTEEMIAVRDSMAFLKDSIRKCGLIWMVLRRLRSRRFPRECGLPRLFRLLPLVRLLPDLRLLGSPARLLAALQPSRSCSPFSMREFGSMAATRI